MKNFYRIINGNLESGMGEVVPEGYIEYDESSKPEELLLKQQEESDLWNATEYARLRKAEYDKLNQDEMRFDDLMNGTTTWQDAILAIKAKYPKPTV